MTLLNTFKTLHGVLKSLRQTEAVLFGLCKCPLPLFGGARRVFINAQKLWHVFKHSLFLLMRGRQRDAFAGTRGATIAKSLWSVCRQICCVTLEKLKAFESKLFNSSASFWRSSTGKPEITSDSVTEGHQVTLFSKLLNSWSQCLHFRHYHHYTRTRKGLTRQTM